MKAASVLISLCKVLQSYIYATWSVVSSVLIACQTNKTFECIRFLHCRALRALHLIVLLSRSFVSFVCLFLHLHSVSSEMTLQLDFFLLICCNRVCKTGHRSLAVCWRRTKSQAGVICFVVNLCLCTPVGSSCDEEPWLPETQAYQSGTKYCQNGMMRFCFLMADVIRYRH